MSELKNYQMFVDGSWIDAAGGGLFESVNPSTGEVWAMILRPMRPTLIVR